MSIRRITSIEMEMRGIERYELEDGRRIDLRRRDIEHYGLWEVLGSYGICRPTGRIPVMQSGVMVGTVPASFDPDHVRSETKIYTPRFGDFVRHDGIVIASGWLGMGDLIAVLDFTSA